MLRHKGSFLAFEVDLVGYRPTSDLRQRSLYRPPWLMARFREKAPGKQTAGKGKR